MYDRVVKAVETSAEVEEAADLLSKMNLASSDIDNIEWKDFSKGAKPQDALDSDDDEDPLAILTSSNSSNQNKKIVRVTRDDETNVQLITAEDIKEAQEIANGGLHLDLVLKHVIDHENFESSKRFLPHKEYHNSLHESTSSEVEKPKKIRDNTAATPPVLTQGVKLLPLGESIKCEYAHRQKMKELQEQQAVERLAMKVKELGENFKSSPAVKTTPTPDASFMSRYRAATSLIDEDNENEESLSEEEDFGDD